MTGRDGPTDDLSDDDLRAEMLPDREAMSLIGSAPLPGYDAAMLPDTSGAGGAATGAVPGADADAGVTEAGGETDADRSETFTASDSAYAGPE